ncbi:MAG: flagellar type III secretion system protein FlhB [Rhodobacteraceae bacterium]|nr:flagellar type III secretion system protein FlhB [Paracoccaceae bacterium]
MSDDDIGEKEHEATPRKLEEARARGQVVKSAEIAVAAAYGGLAAAALGFGAPALQRFGEHAATMLDQADRIAPQLLSGGSATALLLVGSALLPLAMFLLLPALAVLAALLAQRAIVFAPEKTSPKLSRINPLATAKQKFGPDGLFEFAKSTLKLGLVSVLLGMFLVTHLPRAMVAQALSPGLVVAEVMQLLVEFLVIVLGLVGGLGLIDYLWQRHAHLRRNRMSRQELVDEMKQSEGDPHMRAQRHQRAQAIALNQMLAAVPKADVVIVNPTHYAVALRWDRSRRSAPVVVAKGVDEIAARIRAAAVSAGVPIHSDPVTARAIHAAIDIGREVTPNLYPPVAAAIRFAERMRRRARVRRP